MRTKSTGAFFSQDSSRLNIFFIFCTQQKAVHHTHTAFIAQANEKSEKNAYTYSFSSHRAGRNQGGHFKREVLWQGR